MVSTGRVGNPGTITVPSRVASNAPSLEMVTATQRMPRSTSSRALWARSSTPVSSAISSSETFKRSTVERGRRICSMA